MATLRVPSLLFQLLAILVLVLGVIAEGNVDKETNQLIEPRQLNGPAILASSVAPPAPPASVMPPASAPPATVSPPAPVSPPASVAPIVPPVGTNPAMVPTAATIPGVMPTAMPSMGMGGPKGGKGHRKPKGEQPMALRSGSGSASNEFLDKNTFQRKALAVINDFRKIHNAPDVAWNGTLAMYANSWSTRCRFKSSKGPFGEIMASGHSNVSASIASIAYQESKFNFAAPENMRKNKKAMPFSQLVWKNSTQVGCARTNCGGEHDVTGWMVVCEFSPKGNKKGMFAMNVQQSASGVAIGSTIGSAMKGNGDGEVGMSADAGRRLSGGLLAVFVGVFASLILLV